MNARHAGITCLAVIASAAPLHAGSFYEYVDDSGLRVILAERPLSGLVASSMFVGAGSIRESAEMNGAAHFLEHLLFNGTETRTQEELYAEVDRLGAYNNATTQDDFALFMFLVATEDAMRGFGVHADMIFNSTIPESKFDKEKGIVLEELAKDSTTDDWRARVAVDGMFWEGTPLGRPGLGSHASISNMRRDDVVAYYRENYVASNMTLLVMGDFAREEMKDIIAGTYGRQARRGDPVAAPDGAMVMPAGTGRARPVDVANPEVHVRFDAPPPDHPDAWPLRLMIGLWDLSGGALEQAVESDPELPVTAIGAAYNTVGGRSFVSLQATLSPDAGIDDAGHVTTRILAEVHRSIRDGVGDAELARLKTRLRVEESSISDKIHYYALMRGSAVLYGAPEALARRADDISAVSVADVARVCREWLWNAKPRVVGVGSGFPDLDATYPAVSHEDYTPRHEVAPAADTEAVPIGAYPRVTASTGAKWYRIGTGMRVVVASDPRSEVFALHIAARGRSYVEPRGKSGIADFLHRTMLQGTDTWTRSELFARIDAIGASVTAHDNPYIPYDDYYTTRDFSFVRFETIDPYYREACDLVAEMTRAPRIDDGSVREVREKMLGVVSDASSRAVPRGEAVLDSLFYGGDAPEPAVGSPETIESISKKDLLTFRKTYFDPENLFVTVVTSVEPDSVVAALARAFAVPGDPVPAVHPGPPAEPPRKIDRPSYRLDAPPATIHRELGEVQSYAGLGYAFEFDPQDRAALDMASRVLSWRVAFHIRERLGLAYRISCGFRGDDGVGTLVASIGTRPENVDRVLTELAAQIDSVAVAPFEEELIDQLSARSVGQHRMRQITRMGRAYALAVDGLDDNDLGDRRKRLDSVRDVTAADVRRVAERYFDSSRAHRVVIQ